RRRRRRDEPRHLLGREHREQRDRVAVPQLTQRDRSPPQQRRVAAPVAIDRPWRGSDPNHQFAVWKALHYSPPLAEPSRVTGMSGGSKSRSNAVTGSTIVVQRVLPVVEVPHTMLSPTVDPVPQTMLSPSSV